MTKAKPTPPNKTKRTASKTKPARAPAKMGRPTDYTPELAQLICARLAAGESLRKIVADADMPCSTSVFNWLIAHEDFMKQYTRAREIQADLFFDEIVDIVDSAAQPLIIKGQLITREDGSPVMVASEASTGLARLKYDARKWVAGKLKPKVYGEKIDLNHGGQADNPITALIAQISGAGVKPVSQRTEKEVEEYQELLEYHPNDGETS